MRLPWAVSVLRCRDVVGTSRSCRSLSVRTSQPDSTLHDKGNTSQTPTRDESNGLLPFIRKSNNAWSAPARASALPTLDPTRTRVALQPHLRSEPLAVFDRSNETLTLDRVRASLEAYVASLHTSGLSKKAARAKYNVDKPGTKALYWLLQSGLNDSLEFLSNAAFVKVMLYCIVAEQKEDFIWQWLDSDTVPSFVQDKPWRDTIRWKGILLRTMIESQAYWSDERDVLRVPLKSYFRALFRPRDKVADWSRTGVVPTPQSGISLSQQLRTQAGRFVPVETFDLFVKNLLWMVDADNAQFEQSKMLLHHPASPDAIPALAFLRHTQERSTPSVFIDNFLQPQNTAQCYEVFWHLVLVAQTLHRSGKTADSRWTLDYGRDKFPNLFSMGRPNVADRNTEQNLPFLFAGGLRSNTFYQDLRFAYI
ncbi:hypothetical protein LTR27_012097 [Elasticomyces elasticus]|nr:hypothetical protein LTR27_012097 [Elasticomyces elasticus]